MTLRVCNPTKLSARVNVCACPGTREDYARGVRGSEHVRAVITSLGFQNRAFRFVLKVVIPVTKLLETLDRKL